MPFADQLLVAAGSLVTAIAASAVAWYSSRIRAGRLARTVEEISKVCDLTERLTKLQDSVANRPAEDDARKLLQSCLTAVSQDFEYQRRLLPEFESSMSAFRTAMLLFIPKHGGLWPFQVAFHSMLLLTTVVLGRALLFAELRQSDALAVIVAVGAALLIRGLFAALARRYARAA